MPELEIGSRILLGDPAKPAPTICPSAWCRVKEREYNATWTEECQGIATDGVHWYVTSNASRFRQRIYKLNANTFDVECFLPVCVGHLGALTIDDGYLYAAVEQSPQVLRIELASFMTCDVFDFERQPDDGACPWIAIDPRTKLVYTSRFGDTDSPVGLVSAYRLREAARRLVRVPDADIILKPGGEISAVQGGAITPTGYLVLACNTNPALLRCFSMSSGEEFREPCQIEKQSWKGEELEGIAFSTTTCGDALADLHVVLLDNNLSTRDHAIIKHYTAEDLRN